MFVTLLLFVLVQSSTAVIYSLNDSDYARMPPLFHLDPYEECFVDGPDAMFCYAEFMLVSDEPSELLTMIQEFSQTFKHFNHAYLRHGYCMKKTCNKFYNISGSDLDLRSSLEACINETMYKKYRLKSRLTDEIDCSKRDRDQPIDYLDILVAVVCILIIMAILIGSLCDHYLKKRKDRGGFKILCCFSIFRNWKKFVKPVGEGQDPRIKTLAGIHGIRSISIFLVIICHANGLSFFSISNPKYIESLYQNKINSALLNGPIIMQTFFIVSSFLLVYIWLIYLEVLPISWSMLPKHIILRWLRLTPSYALIMGLTATWFRRLASGGPLWEKFIYYEARDCRRDWWKHILYINNYMKRGHCMPQTWYLAADTQLYFFGVFIFLICRTNLTRKVVLSVLFVVGIIIPALHTYYEELNGVLIVSLELIMNLFIGDPTFDKIYTRAHTNMVGYIIGMALGYMIYNWQKAGGDPKQFQKYRYLYWSLILVAALIFSSGYIFFAEGPPLPMFINALYAGLQKPVFGLVMATIIAGIIIQFEGFYRSILEWRPFIFTSRLSYSAYLLHMVFIRTKLASVIALQRTVLFESALQILTLLVGNFIAAFFFCLMVEMPFANLIRCFFKIPHIESEEQNKETVKNIKNTKDETAIDMSQSKIEDGIIVIKMGNLGTR